MERLVRLRSSLGAVLAISLVLTATAVAHNSGTDGGPAERGCEPVLNDRYYVGATNVDCGRAKAIARAQIKSGRQFYYWRCTGRGTTFGHCHGTGRWRGSMVHWAAND